MFVNKALVGSCLALLLAVAAGSTVSPLGSATLYLARHGQSKANVWPNRLVFDCTDAPLTELGKTQAKGTGSCLSEHAAPDLIFASCLVRAQETALLAYANETIRVAPYISEVHGTLAENDPKEMENQLAVVRDSLSAADAARDSFVWVSDWTTSGDWPSACVPPNFTQFLGWLASRADVRALVETRLKSGVSPRIAVFSHGMTLHNTLVEHGWSGHAKIRNAEVFEATLPLLGDAASGSFVRFGRFTNVTVLCKGFKNSIRTSVDRRLLICAGVAGLVCCFAGIWCCCCRKTAASKIVDQTQQRPLLPET